MDLPAATLIRHIKEEQHKLQASLAENPRTDYASYREAVGRHQGLSDALGVIEALLEQEKNGDRDPSQRFRQPSHAYG